MNLNGSSLVADKKPATIPLSISDGFVTLDNPQTLQWAVWFGFFDFGLICPFKMTACDVKGVACSGDPWLTTQQTVPLFFSLLILYSLPQLSCFWFSFTVEINTTNHTGLAKKKEKSKVNIRPSMARKTRDTTVKAIVAPRSLILRIINCQLLIP